MLLLLHLHAFVEKAKVRIRSYVSSQRNTTARRWYHRVPHSFDFEELRLKMKNGADIRTSNLMSDSELDEFEVGVVVDACVQ